MVGQSRVQAASLHPHFRRTKVYVNNVSMALPELMTSGRPCWSVVCARAVRCPDRFSPTGCATLHSWLQADALRAVSN